MERLECQETCFSMAPKTGPKKLLKYGCDKGTLTVSPNTLAPILCFLFSFGIVMAPIEKRPPPPTGNQKHNRGNGGGSHPARSSRCTVRQASHGSPMLAIFFPFFKNKNKKGSMGYVYGCYQSWVSHVGNLRYNRAIETDLVVLLLVWYFLGGRILSMKRLR